jgi:hypothetical protein
MNRRLLASASVQFLLLLVSTKGASAADAIPAISTASVPLYPNVAQSARVQGSVRMRVTTDGRRVVRVENLSLETQKGAEPEHPVPAEVHQAYRALAESAEQNVATWTFLPGAPTSFIVSYRYRLIDGADAKNAKVIMTFPADVEVLIGIPVIEIDTP